MLQVEQACSWRADNSFSCKFKQPYGGGLIGYLDVPPPELLNDAKCLGEYKFPI